MCTHTHRLVTCPSTLNWNDTKIQTSAAAAAEAWNCLSFLLLIAFHSQWNKERDTANMSLCVCGSCLIHLHGPLSTLKEIWFSVKDSIYAWRYTLLYRKWSIKQTQLNMSANGILAASVHNFTANWSLYNSLYSWREILRGQREEYNGLL